MDKERRKGGMIIPTIIMGLLAGILFFIACFKGQGQHISGLRQTLQMTAGILPLLTFALIVAGMIQVLLPHELLSKWVGEQSGIRGIMIGTIAGGLSPGGPYVCLPIVAGIKKKPTHKAGHLIMEFNGCTSP